MELSNPVAAIDEEAPPSAKMKVDVEVDEESRCFCGPERDVGSPIAIGKRTSDEVWSEALAAKPAKQLRHTQLDALRAACAIWVLGPHVFAGGIAANPLFVINWVMQYLALISGVLWAMTRTSVYAYAKRLAAILLFGCTLNAIPICIRLQLGRPQLMRAGVVLGSIWQFWYVIVLLAAIIVLAPLKASIERNSTKAYGLCGGLYALSLVVCGAWSVVAWTQDTSNRWSDPFGVKQSPFYMAHTFGFLVTATGGLYLRKDRSADTSWLGWILLFYTHFLIAVVEVKRAGQFTLFFQIMACGMVLYHAPLCGRAYLQDFIHSFWPIFTFLLYMCVLYIRVSPMSFPHVVVNRARIAFTNFAFCAVFAILWCPSALEKIYPERVGACWRMGDAGRTAWLARWSLTVYMLHIALWDVANIVNPEIDTKSPHVPLLVAGCTIASTVPFWLLSQRGGKFMETET